MAEFKHRRIWKTFFLQTKYNLGTSWFNEELDQRKSQKMKHPIQDVVMI